MWQEFESASAPIYVAAGENSILCSEMTRTHVSWMAIIFLSLLSFFACRLMCARHEPGSPCGQSLTGMLFRTGSFQVFAILHHVHTHAI